MKDAIIKGRAWVIKDHKSGELIDNIDTDMIYHNAHLAVTNIKEMGQYAFGNLKGWEDFPKRVQKGDIIILGENFGAGSSRQHAVDCFRALGVCLIIAKSYGAIYKRNAINSGMPIFTYPNIDVNNIEDNEIIEVNLEIGNIKNITRGINLNSGIPFSKVQMDIYNSGNLFEYAKRL